MPDLPLSVWAAAAAKRQSVCLTSDQLAAVVAIVKERDQWRERFLKYADHSYYCPAKYNTPRPCDCGLEALLGPGGPTEDDLDDAVVDLEARTIYHGARPEKAPGA